ncbi:ATP-binding protein [Flavobacterium sediminis]|uniref:ATP-binding protein n=1 Tax=Flavobacterium sediminis TaxID=2201181 RepID=UPI0029373CFA|nr:ATP-binding protein [Flavobacterium sediminis]
MLTRFQNHIENKFPFLKESPFYIAVSGGIDSMVLAHLFQQLGYSFSVLHCNFQLRAKKVMGTNNL